MAKKRILTGVTTTGIPHLGNYVGAIRPAIQAAAAEDTESYLFLAMLTKPPCRSISMQDWKTKTTKSKWDCIVTPS